MGCPWIYVFNQKKHLNIALFLDKPQKISMKLTHIHVWFVLVFKLNGIKSNFKSVKRFHWGFSQIQLESHRIEDKSNKKEKEKIN